MKKSPLLITTTSLLLITLPPEVSAQSNNTNDNVIRLTKPAQVSVAFESLDFNNDDILEKQEIIDFMSVLFDEQYKTPRAPVLTQMHFGKTNKTNQKPKPKVIREYSKEDFVNSNTSRLLENDQNKDEKLTRDEYQVRDAYNYSKEECLKIIEEQDKKPKSFGAIQKSILNGDSNKKSFCQNKYKLYD